MRIGDKVRIERAVLAGLEGMLLREKIQSSRRVGVELLQGAVAVRIDRDVLRTSYNYKSVLPVYW